MALSIPADDAWDFKSASSPLVGKIAGATWANSGLTVNTTNGVNHDGAGVLSMTSIPAALNNGTLPVTLVYVITPRVTQTTFFALRFWRRSTNAPATRHGLRYRPGSTYFEAEGLGTDSSSMVVSVSVSTQTVIFWEITSTSEKLWQDTTLIRNFASTNSAPGAASTDTMYMAADGGDDLQLYQAALGQFSGVLTAGDRTAIVADYTEMTTAPAPTFFRPYFITG